jgi:murein DD-endopeptidase MepM/ murein hydrolase activator NlpD
MNARQVAVGVSLLGHDTLTAMTAKLSAIALTIAAIPFMPLGASAQPLLRTSLSPPVRPACISSSFGPRVLPNAPGVGSYHYGVDLPAAQGASVFAIAPGTVIRIQQNGPGGLEMLIQHDGFVGVYSHFGMIMPDFAAGKRNVAAGERLGVVGMTGVTFGPHLYFEMIMAGKPIDPAPYLNVAQCNGAARPAATVTPDDGSVMIDGRKYWQFSAPARQYIQWHQN